MSTSRNNVHRLYFDAIKLKNNTEWRGVHFKHPTSFVFLNHSLDQFYITQTLNTTQRYPFSQCFSNYFFPFRIIFQEFKKINAKIYIFSFLFKNHTILLLIYFPLKVSTIQPSKASEEGRFLITYETEKAVSNKLSIVPLDCLQAPSADNVEIPAMSAYRRLHYP